MTTTDGGKAAQLTGLVKQLEASREEAADLRARLPGLRQLSTDVQEKDDKIQALEARLAEVEKERDEARDEAGQRRAEGAELRITLENRDAALELLNLQVGPNPL